jgi:hypothetical protein
MSSQTGYVYNAIPADNIRLLKLEPGGGDQSLVCQLFSARLAESPSYEAISYVWGDTTVKVSTLCSGKSMDITVNLRDVLQRIRRRDAERLVWVDALCINQQSLQEREEQVRMMGSIFATATQVLAWARKDPGDAEVAINFIRFFNSKADYNIKRYGSWSHVPKSREEIVQSAKYDYMCLGSRQGLFQQSLLHTCVDHPRARFC